MTITKILDGLYLSGINDVTDINILDLHITHIINMSPYNANITVPVIYQKYPTDDSISANIAFLLHTVSNQIDILLKADAHVLVHCIAGISRSATMIIAYLIKHKHMPFLEAFKFVKMKRPMIDPNRGFIIQLLAFDKMVK